MILQKSYTPRPDPEKKQVHQNVIYCAHTVHPGEIAETLATLKF
jgi:hypothetical protein